MGSQSSKPYANMQLFKFKNAMMELAKNKNMTLDTAEKAIGLEAGFTELVARGVTELALSDVIKISKYFNTTMDSVLDGGNCEIRIRQICPDDALASLYFEECMKLYADILHEKTLEFWVSVRHDKRILDKEAKLEGKEQNLLERFKEYMDEYARQTTQPKEAAKCCDEVLINELVKRGFKVEKGDGDGKTANESGR